LSFFSSLLRGDRARRSVRPLYEAAVAAARDARWYREGGVPDTIDGRFDMLASVVALILIRLEEAGDEGRAPAVLFAETFIDDMDGTLRELGVGDVVVGKRVGKMMGALGGRAGAFRRGLGGEEDFTAAVRRNIFRDEPPSDEAVEFVASRLRQFDSRLREAALEQLLAGKLPTP
jgi:cytochrome b pre-mRNA-processing protein 3